MEMSGVEAPDTPNRYKGATVTPPSEDYRLIPLTQGQFAKVDTEDFERISKWKWHAYWEPLTRSFYAEAWDYRNGKTRIKMHREIMGCVRGDGKQVDHENGDTLDNRRSNLRFVNHAQNQMNRKLQSNSSSGHRGVSFCKQTGKWKVRVEVGDRVIWKGRFADKNEAIRIAIETRREAYGEFARQS